MGNEDGMGSQEQYAEGTADLRMNDNAASIINDRNHRLFDRQMLEEIRQRRADQQIQPSPEEDGMFQDPLLELYRKPDPTLVD